MYDADSNGALDPEEFQHLAEAVTGTMSSPADFKKLLETVDLDGNGTISFAEFKHFVESSNSSALAQTLRGSVFEQLAEVEEAVLGVVQPFFAHGAEPSLSVEVSNNSSGGSTSAGEGEGGGGSGGLPVRPTKRLALSSRAKACSGLCGLMILFVINMLASPPALFLSDFVVADRIGSSSIGSSSSMPRFFASPDGGALSQAWTKFDSEQVKIFGKIEMEKPGSAGDCIHFVKTTCTWKGGEFGKNEFRECSKRVHPDKKGGSSDDFLRLQDCNNVLTQMRSVCFLAFLSASASFCFIFTLLAGVSSCSAALAFAAASALRVELLLGAMALAAAPDLAGSLRVFIAIYAAGLLVLTAFLVEYRRQSSFAEWVSGSRVCCLSGNPASRQRLLCRDLSQGLFDTAIIVAISKYNGESLEDRVTFVASLAILLLCVRPVMSFFERENRGPVDKAVGTVLLSQVRRKAD